MARSEYPNYSVCKTCNRFVDCKSKNRTVVSCDKFVQASPEEMVDAPEYLSVKVVMK